MARPPFYFVPLLLALAALGGSPASLGDESENLGRLQAMPRERRVALSENLERFDKLDPAEQSAIRKLDAQIARKDPVEQARYRALLGRYHLWVNGLSEEDRKKLKDADGTEARYNEARKLRMKEIEAGATGLRVFGIRTGDLGVNGPYEVAHLLKIWKLLTPMKRAEIEREKDRVKLLTEVKAQQRSVGVPFQAFPHAEHEKYEAPLETNEDFKKQLGPYGRRHDVLKKKAEALAKAEATPKTYELRFAEFLYFEQHKPKAVRQADLERFSASCPNWLHEMLDPLSPDDARAYLTILYRLLYPEPGEMPVETKAGKASAPSKAATPRTGTNKGPF
jgi:hypothetical protein